MKSGQGMAGIQAGSLQARRHRSGERPAETSTTPDTGRALAGVYDRGNIADPLTIFDQMADDVRDLPQGNTTIGCVITNARLNKAQCNKIASITHNAYARTIFPVHTMSDGDTVFVMSTGECDAMPDAVGAFAVQAMSPGDRPGPSHMPKPHTGFPPARAYTVSHRNGSRKGEHQ